MDSVYYRSGGAGGDGGGICNVGELALNSCVINSNFSGAGGRGGVGPDLGLRGRPGAGGSGGGISNLGILGITNSTISGNHCGVGGDGWDNPGGIGGQGGGICSAGALNLLSCTIALNETGLGGQSDSVLGPVGNGGGVLNETNRSAVFVRNTLIARNSVGVGSLNVAGADLGGDFTSQGYNLIGHADGSSGLTNGINNDLAGTIAAPLDPRIGPLQNNGGPTFTHALLRGSPAIDQGKRFGFARDQRGRHRPHDYASILNAPGGDGSDIGAFELDMPILCITRLADRTVISWDVNSSDYTLEFSTDSSSSAVWTPVTGTPCIVGGQCQITEHDSPAAGIKFFRLRKD